MWKAKFRVYDETGTFAALAKKYKTPIHGYMINYYTHKNYFYFTLAIFLNCNEETKKKIVKELREFKTVNRFEDQGNFLICELKAPSKIEKKKRFSLFYNPSLIQVKPFVVGSDGWEELEFAAFERKSLEKLLEISEKAYKLKLLYFREEKIDSLGVINIFPELTSKQKDILNLAIGQGYYSYPRKTNVKKLAKENKISFSTFQEHLRKAENKLIPFLSRKSNL